MKKSDLEKDVLDKKHEQYLEEYKTLMYALIGSIGAYFTSKFYELSLVYQGLFFEAIVGIFYLIRVVMKDLKKVRKDILRIKLEKR